MNDPVDPVDPGAESPEPAEPPVSAAPPASSVSSASAAPPASDAPPTSGAPPEPLAPAPPPPPVRAPLAPWAERPEVAIDVPKRVLEARSRRDFLIFAGGVAATAVGAWWLLPDAAKSRLAPGRARDKLDTLAGRVGLTREARERTLDRALTFDDDVAEALYSRDRRVRTYDRKQVTPLRNNYAGRTPDPDYLATWTLTLSGLASGTVETLTLDALVRRFALHGQVTRLVCVEGWSAIAWWGGLRFADLLDAYPPAPGARWAAMRSAVNLDGHGNPDPYYVSIDLGTARHPQTLLATHFAGEPLPLEHGAPLRLVVPMKLGLKNIKAITHITYTGTEPPDYWNERGYSKYDGL